MTSDVNSQSKSRRLLTAKNITYFSVLLALVIVLQLFASTVKIGPAEMSFVLVPIVLAALILGPWAGCALGFAFGLIVFIQGLFGLNEFTALLISDHPISTFIICVLKGAACGFVSGVLYNAIKAKNGLVASFVAAAAAPIVNTGIFILGGLLFVSDTLKTNFLTDGTTIIYFLIIACAGVNFLIELTINLVCAPAIFRITGIVEKQIMKKGNNL